MASGSPSSGSSLRSLSDRTIADLRRSLIRALPNDVARVAVSRVSTLPLNRILAPRIVVTLPVVWGRTLWHLAATVSVVEQPNGLGCLETRGAPLGSVIVKTVRGVPDPPGGSLAVIDMRGDSPNPGDELHLARRLRGRLAQVAGLQPATPHLESARFAMLCSRGSAELLATTAPAGVVVTPLPVELGEYPGGVRVEVGGGAVESADAVADRFGSRGAP